MMITAENRLHDLLMTRTARVERKTHLVESGTEVETSSTKRKSELTVNYSHSMLFNISFIGEKEINLRRERLERQKRNE